MVKEHAEQAAYFDRWYTDMAGAWLKDEIQQRHLGLPPELLSTSLLTWDGIAEYRLGDLVATGLSDGAADAVVVVDAIQFPFTPTLAYAEIVRILRPGGPPARRVRKGRFRLRGSARAHPLARSGTSHVDRGR